MNFKARFLPMVPKPSTRVPTCPKCFMQVTMLYLVVPTATAKMKAFWFYGKILPKVFLRLKPCDHELFGNDIGAFSVRVMGLNTEEMADAADADLSQPQPMFEEG